MELGNLLGRSIYGQKFDYAKEIKLIENNSNGDEFTAISNGKSVLVTEDFLNDLAVNLRLNYKFVDSMSLPKAIYKNPNINLQPLEIINPTVFGDYFFIIPSDKYPLDENGVVHLENGAIAVLSDEAKKIIEQDGKIGINPHSKQWCSMYEAPAQNAYMQGLESIEITKQLIQEKIDLLSEAIKENKKINRDLPLRKGIYVGIVKARLSGLSEKSIGCGSAKDTVVHLGVLNGGVEALKEVTSDQYLASISDFFCSYKPTGKFRGVYHHEINLDATKIEETGVTCKACLNRMKKLFK